MCGICGAVWTSARKATEESVLGKATDAMRRRGPDARGVVRVPLEPGTPVEEKGVAFGHRRLAIIDLSDAGRQPFANDECSIWLTFNGEIYNYIEIRNELKRRGRIFRTETDVEVLLRAYEEFGVDCLPKLNGMFAFAIWDSRKKRLLIARDRIGKKPLFYRVEAERLLFASELKALTLFPNVPKELDLTALRQYLTYQYVPYPRTIYRGIAKLPPASFLIWQDGKDLTVERYWKAEDVANFDEKRKYAPGDVERALKSGALGAARFGAEDGWFGQEGGDDEDALRGTALKFVDDNDFTERSFDETARELRRRLEEATRLRMRSDAPFGAFLSGGVDSTVVVGLMKQFSEKKIRTFSIGFAQKEYDETPFARRTAALFGTEHTEFFVEPDAETILTPLVREYGEPFADSSAIPTWYLCETTRREATVALGGDGGDELFCGYDRYKAIGLSLLINKAPKMLRRFLAGPFRAAIPNSVRQRSPLRRARRFLETVGMDALEQYLQWIAIFNRERLHSLLSEEYWAECAKEAEFDGGLNGGLRLDGTRPSADELDCVDFLQDAFQKFRRRDLTSAISFVDLTTYMPGDLTTKVDVASMRSSLEVRAPMLDPNVVELALQIPLKYKLWGKKGKYVLREACRDLLPPEIDARPKTGFGVPLDAWFRGPLNKTLKDALLTESANAAPFFEKKFVERLIKEHENREFDHAARLWALLVFRIWEEQVKNC
ncbi:MAG: asparagine synthetase B [Thermoguttaceae bacterium]|nr:asparagine synthetase B [Thermoguttaceae bacterium]